MPTRPGIVLAAAFWAAPAWSQLSTATLRGVDLYRSSRVTLEAVQAKAGGLIEQYARLRGDDRPGSERSAEQLKTTIVSRIRELGAFAYVDLYYAEYVSSSERKSYVTVDLVDAKDARTRMPFRPAPRGHVPDPGGLLAAWKQYHDLGTSLVRQGVLSPVGGACPSFLCLWPATTPELASFERRFVEGVLGHRKALVKVLETDADPGARAAAIYVLAHMSDGAALAGFLYKALEDPAPEARAAALQILSDMALYHPKVFLEAPRLVAALDYPSGSDRAKALAMLVGLTGNPTYKPYVVSRAPPHLLALLRMEQPSHHDMAFVLLTMLSGETYGRRDYASWEAWVRKVSSPEAPAGRSP